MNKRRGDQAEERSVTTLDETIAPPKPHQMMHHPARLSTYKDESFWWLSAASVGRG
jgi:hypothetical protein